MRRFFLLMFLAALFASDCVASDQGSLEAAFFRGRTYVQRMSEFRNYRVDTQLELFFYGNQVIHPPATYLASCFAMNGPSGVRVIRRRLSGHLTTLEMRDIALLLETMQAMGTYSVRDDETLMAAIEKSVSEVAEGGWKESIDGMVEQIKSGRVRVRSVNSHCGVRERVEGKGIDRIDAQKQIE
ncbi:hypothetical protein J2X57_003757 [Luteibacter sp. 1214]|uniref:hypothetical protein n=2 Tax=unclassified Luteibacter TaxID=2620188 RepID=UPI002856762B|nr:hypothetical protein [Luteibacter sp. 1214]MDR6644514.1 hypothetical protein [Luteibacter sp. 1214]